MESVKSTALQTGQVVGSHLTVFAGQAKVHGGAAANRIGEEASKLKAKIQEK